MNEQSLINIQDVIIPTVFANTIMYDAPLIIMMNKIQ
jgi:hypothetical protein